MVDQGAFLGCTGLVPTAHGPATADSNLSSMPATSPVSGSIKSLAYLPRIGRQCTRNVECARCVNKDRKTKKKKKRKTRSTHARTHARGMAVSKITPSDTPALLRRQHDPHNAMLNEHWNSAVPHRTSLDVLGFVLFILEQYWNQFAPNIFDVIRNLVHHQCHRWLFRIQRHGIHLEFNKIGNKECRPEILLYR